MAANKEVRSNQFARKEQNDTQIEGSSKKQIPVVQFILTVTLSIVQGIMNFCYTQLVMDSVR